MPDSVCSVFTSETTASLSSTDAGVATTIDSRNFRNGYIGIKNTGATNTVQYKIESYMLTAGTIVIADVAYTDIAPGAQATFKVDNAPRAKFVVTVKSKVSSSHSTFIVEHCLGL